MNKPAPEEKNDSPNDWSQTFLGSLLVGAILVAAFVIFYPPENEVPKEKKS